MAKLTAYAQCSLRLDQSAVDFPRRTKSDDNKQHKRFHLHSTPGVTKVYAPEPNWNKWSANYRNGPLHRRNNDRCGVRISLDSLTLD